MIFSGITTTWKKENKLISSHDPQKVDGKLLKIVKEYLFENHGIIKMLRQNDFCFWNTCFHV